MSPKEIKNKIVDIAKRNDLSHPQKLEQLTNLLSDKLGPQAEAKARQMLNKFCMWEDYILTILAETEPFTTDVDLLHCGNPSKYFDVIKFYELHKDEFDEILNEEIKDGISQTMHLVEIAENKKKEGNRFCDIYRINIALFFVPDSSYKFITLSRFVAVLGYLNAIRGLKAVSTLAKQIYWDNCSQKIQDRKHLFFTGCEHLLASILMGSGSEFDLDDVAFLYGATTVMEYLGYCNIFKKKNPFVDVKDIPPIEKWLLMKPPTDCPFKKKYPELEAILKGQPDGESQNLVENMINNARVKEIIPELERLFENRDFNVPTRHRIDSDDSTNVLYFSRSPDYHSGDH